MYRTIILSFCLFMLALTSCTENEAKLDVKDNYFQSIAESVEYSKLMVAKSSYLDAFQVLDQEKFETFISSNQEVFSDPELEVSDLPKELLQIEGAESYLLASLNFSKARENFSELFPEYDSSMDGQDRMKIMKLYNTKHNSQPAY